MIDISYRPQDPRNYNPPIGLIGCGGISEHHLHGADLVLQVGTEYYGCRGDDGKFSMGRLVETPVACFFNRSIAA